MKSARLPGLLFFLFSLFTFSQCKKNKTDPPLPPETITGAMTFGCKVNGKVFVPEDGNGKPGLFVEYPYLGNGPDGGFHLNIPAFNYQSSPKRGVSIVTDSLLLFEGVSYYFEDSIGSAKAFYLEEANNGLVVYHKLKSDTGSLFITRHDQVNKILSGTFSFSGTNDNGAKVYVTEGRFDIRY